MTGNQRVDPAADAGPLAACDRCLRARHEADRLRESVRDHQGHLVRRALQDRDRRDHQAHRGLRAVRHRDVVQTRK